MKLFLRKHGSVWGARRRVYQVTLATSKDWNGCQEIPASPYYMESSTTVILYIVKILQKQMHSL